jgi:lipopolysaccharide export system permease protein
LSKILLDKLYFYGTLDSLTKASMDTIEDLRLPDLMSIERTNHRRLAAEAALNNVRQLKESALFNHEDTRIRKRGLARYQIEFHRKFTLSFACLVLFMIGAPLGAIIRKGGFGLPVVVSVLFFVLFHVMSITG